MGSGVSTSSTVRVRKSIIIRAYNLRKADETIDEQFSIYAKRYDNKLMIKLEDIKACLKIEDGALWSSMVEIFQQCISVNLDGTAMDYRAFREFLEDGKIPSAPNRIITTDRNETIPIPPEIRENMTPKGVKDQYPPKNPTPGICKTQMNDDIDEDILMSVDIDGKVSPSYIAHSTAIQQELAGILVPAGHKMMHMPGPGKPLWKKKEITRVERTIEYITIDAEGAVQELLERETTETEVLHMECRETGEFAHRETTQYTQKETFNNEVVTSQMGTEEYVHMKSLEDEYECMESTMPNKGREQGREEEEQGREEEEQRRREEQGTEEEEQGREEDEQGKEYEEQDVAGVSEAYKHSSDNQSRNDNDFYKNDPDDDVLGLDIPHREIYGDEISDSDNINDYNKDLLDNHIDTNFKKKSRNHLFDPPSPEYKKSEGENEENVSEKSLDFNEENAHEKNENDCVKIDTPIKRWDSADID
jgi:hypothetical protein